MLTFRRKVLLASLTALVVVIIAEALSAVALSVAGSLLDEPVRRTPRIYAEQSRQIREMFFTGPPRGIGFDADLGWIYTAGWKDSTTVMNSAALRGPREYAPAPAHGTVRIAAFGDSFVYGNEVGWSDSWPAVMEQADPTLEVMNYGVGGYGVDQAFLRFQREGRALSPSVVIIGFTTDDLGRLVNVYRRFLSSQELPLFKPRFQIGEGGGLRLLSMPLRSVEDYKTLLEDPRRVRAFGQHDQWYEPLVYANPLYDWSATIRLMSATWIRIANRYFRRDRIYAGEAFNTGSQAFKLQVALFKAFHDSIAAAGYAPVVVFLPDRSSLTARSRGGRPRYVGLAAALDSLRIPYLDTADGFAERFNDGSIDQWFKPGGHYSKEGNLIVARWLAPRVRALAPEPRLAPWAAVRPLRSGRSHGRDGRGPRVQLGADQRTCSQDRLRRSERELRQQPAEAGLGLGQIVVMAQAAKKRRADARLIGVNLPRVQVEDGRPALDDVHLRKAAPGPCIRQQPEVSTATDRQVLTSPANGRSWKFPQAATRGRDEMKVPRRIRYTVAIVVNGVNTGVVGVALVNEDVERPQ